MERLGTALKNRLRLEVLRSNENHQGLLAAGDVAWAVEPSDLFGEDFSVDDLLDFGGIIELEEKETEEEEVEVERAEVEPFQISGSNSGVSLDLFAPCEIEFPEDDVEELEWVSRFFDDSFMESSPSSEITAPSLKRPRPVSCIVSLESLAPVKAKRSKRSRAASGAVWSTVGPLALPDSSSTSSNSFPSSPSSSSCLIYDPAASGFAAPDLVLLAATPPQVKKDDQKKRGRKPKRPKPPAAAAGGGGGGERRCSHCGAQKTPQWRAGPLGSKTLCNACGVRFKSGRLLPEYRPACSPTFLSDVHSNSHRKVLEMRRQKEEEEKQLLSTSSSSSSAIAAALAVPSPSC